MSKDVILHMQKINVSFDEVKALINLDFNIFKGEIHGLTGEHRAGKSTLAKVISGAIQPDSGIININGKEYKSLTPALAMLNKINAIYQEMSLIPVYNAIENIFLGKQLKRGLQLRHREMREIVDGFFKKYDYLIDIDTPVRNLTVPQQQMVELARSLIFNNRIVILDELSQKLTPEEMRLVYRMIFEYQKKGTSFLYISNDMNEILDIAERVTIIQNGNRVGTEYTDDLDLTRLTQLTYSFAIYKEKPPGFTDKLYLIKKCIETISLGVNEAIMLLDDGGHVLYSSVSFSSFFRERKIEDIIGNHISFLDMPKKEIDFLNEAIESKSIYKTGTFPTPGGKEIEIFLNPIDVGKKNIFLLIIKDVSFEYDIHDYVVQTEKMASIAEVSVGVAHEINNPLCIIKNYLRIMKKNNDNNKLILIEKEIDRITTIVSNLLSYSRKSPSDERVNLFVDIIQQVVELIQHTFDKKSIKIKTKVSPTDLKTTVSANSLKQVLINILMNSYDASLNHSQVEIICFLNDNQHIQIDIKDYGHGIPLSIQQNIFQPFFSTKLTKKNTGLGLSICRQLVHDMGGSLSVESKEGNGATFQILLPNK